MTNAQAFLAFATSPTMTAAHASEVSAALNNYVELATGIPSGGSGPGAEAIVQDAQNVQIVGQADHVAAA